MYFQNVTRHTALTYARSRAHTNHLQSLNAVLFLARTEDQMAFHSVHFIWETHLRGCSLARDH